MHRQGCDTGRLTPKAVTCEIEGVIFWWSPGAAASEKTQGSVRHTCSYSGGQLAQRALQRLLEVGPKRKDEKNLLLLCYDTLVSHSKEEDHSISPLDKQVARYQGGLLKTSPHAMRT